MRCIASSDPRGLFGWELKAGDVDDVDVDVDEVPVEAGLLAAV